MGEEGGDFHRAEVSWVALPAELDVAPDPADVALFGAQAVMSEPDLLPDGTEQRGARRDHVAFVPYDDTPHFATGHLWYSKGWVENGWQSGVFVTIWE